ncbi:helix-turn-helix domain-containing protein [Paenibacillus macerans]|uniref:Helix-turn-helix conjugative transposon-like domain-containing protein n=1 Tax=Paenibacillus macerans TaxID=44252 RepID=A0A090ZHU0_PAEMA|nr:helix-turn-helix domain-containing protein [Paenibacillus macerans]KFN10177.1 hypothetical protein DJ90_406 [Paenibacillus macerans]MBS5913156.1 helix-turn-helix domain-containing protein [Paenibacillus macerans]MCY7557405.1 helix-turn-helix domain-containing protein [Paenibacillus macerans]MEC0135901.1 helix-turn-helix domain-containing protein [Paenibacillus macerans]MEC0154254.1 helix-turn-helix domain-containing protein [Paenibacillus macerans]
MEMENDLFDLVARAQNGDKDALTRIIVRFLPAIRAYRYKAKADRQDDLEQYIIETLIKRIMTYDLTNSPDFTDFCRKQVEDEHKD